MSAHPITISVETGYVENQSDPAKQRYVFFYTITIKNVGESDCQLISRHWLIQHGQGRTEEVYGEGVVGEQPVITPGGSYTYTSGAVLETEFGSMQGRYFMIQRDEDGNARELEAPIPQFTLCVPRTLH